MIQRPVSLNHPNGDKLVYVDVIIQNVPASFLIDTGANITLINPRVYNEILNTQVDIELNSAEVEMKTANGEQLECQGRCHLEIEIDELSTTHDVFVANIDVEGILGIDFLSKYECQLDLKQNQMMLGELPGNHADPEECDVPETMFCATVAAQDTTNIPPKSQSLIFGKVQTKEGIQLPNACVVETAYSFAERHSLLVAHALVNPQEQEVVIRVLNPTDKAVTIHQATVVAQLEPVEVFEQTYCNAIHLAEPTTSHPDKNETFSEDKREEADEFEIPEHLHDLYERSQTGLLPTEKIHLSELLIKHAVAFSKTKDDIGRTKLVQHRIDTGDAHPVRQRARRLPIHQRAEEKKQIEDMLRQDVIEPSNSPWASPLVLVRRQRDNKVRCCVDFRGLNLLTKKDSYPLPRIDDTLDTLVDSQYFTTLDLSSGYWQVEVAPEDREKTAVITNFGLYQFKVLPFGVCNGPATFERLMETVLRGLQWTECLIYLDDIIVPGKTFSQAADRLQLVLERLTSAGLKLNAKKCNLFQSSVAYLGHVVSREGVATDPAKVIAVHNWPTPKSVSDVRSYLGTTSYYRRYIRGYSEIAKPLHILTEKNRVFTWTEDAQKAFDTLKEALTTAPILAYPNPTDPFILDCDASNHGVAGVLSQIQNGHERVIAYYSRTLNKGETRYCVTRKELLAIVASVRHFHHYLYGMKFLIRTDHGALRWLMRFKNPEGQVARWIEVLGNYDLEIEHRNGRNHGNADGLSRRPCEGDRCPQCERIERNNDEKSVNISCRRQKDTNSTMQQQEETEESGDTNEVLTRVSTISTDNTSNWMMELTTSQWRREQLDDPNIGKIIELKETDPNRPTWEQVSAKGSKCKAYWTLWDQLEMQDGILYYRRIDTRKMEKKVPVLPQILTTKVLELLHDSRVGGGHLGYKKTLAKIRDRYFWAGCTSDVKLWCSKCTGCAQKRGPARGARAPMKIYVVGAPAERVALDILGPLPISSRGNRFILVIGDYFTKWMEAVALPDQETTTITEAFINVFISKFGIPRILHSDQGSNFGSKIFAELCKLLGIDKTRTTAYRPQSDGLVERFNLTLAGMLARFTAKDQKDWDCHLPYVLLAYRSAVHESTGFSPNMMMLGREVRLPVDLLYGRPPNTSNDHNLPEYIAKQAERIEKVYEFARANLQIASESQKKQYDHRTTKSGFAVNDKVWIYHSIRKKGVSTKLQDKWEGPFVIEERINDVLYRIKNMPSRRADVVHVDKLKPYNENTMAQVSFGDDVGVKSEPSFQVTKGGRKSRPPQWYGI